MNDSKDKPLKLTFERGGCATMWPAVGGGVELSSIDSDTHSSSLTMDRIEWLAFRILGDHVAGLTAVENLHARIVKAAGKAKRESDAHHGADRIAYCEGTEHGLNEAARMLRESPIGGWVYLPGDVRLRIEDGQPAELATPPASGNPSSKGDALRAAAKFLGYSVEVWGVWCMNPKTRRLHVHVQKAKS